MKPAMKLPTISLMATFAAFAVVVALSSGDYGCVSRICRMA